MSRGFCRFGMEGQTIQSIQVHHHGQQVLFPASGREVGNRQKWRKAPGPNDPQSLSGNTLYAIGNLPSPISPQS